MNDKIKQLLENAEQSDAIAKNKWRIENREQLRKERKEKLKELMEKDKQQTAVPIGIATYDNVEWVYQFNDDNPILISKPIGGEKELIIKLNNKSCSNIVFHDGKGNTFKIFAREQTL
jgi:hypothetical protein